jgi:hypothetical protein
MNRLAGLNLQSAFSKNSSIIFGPHVKKAKPKNFLSFLLIPDAVPKTLSNNK